MSVDENCMRHIDILQATLCLGMDTSGTVKCIFVTTIKRVQNHFIILFVLFHSQWTKNSGEYSKLRKIKKTLYLRCIDIYLIFFFPGTLGIVWVFKFIFAHKASLSFTSNECVAFWKKKKLRHLNVINQYFKSILSSLVS